MASARPHPQILTSTTLGEPCSASSPRCTNRREAALLSCNYLPTDLPSAPSSGAILTFALLASSFEKLENEQHDAEEVPPSPPPVPPVLQLLVGGGEIQMPLTL